MKNNINSQIEEESMLSLDKQEEEDSKLYVKLY